MKTLYKIGLSLIVIIALTGCNESDSKSENTTDDNIKSETPANENKPVVEKTYNLKALYSYRTNMNLTGFDNEGGDWAMSAYNQYVGTTYYNGYEFSVSETHRSVAELNSGFSYSDIITLYTNVEGYIQYKASANTGVICGLDAKYDLLPTDAEIGDFGNAGNYTCSDGSTSNSNWSLSTNNEGEAEFIINSHTALNGEILYASAVTVATDSSEIEIVEYDYYYGVVYTLEGNLY